MYEGGEKEPHRLHGWSVLTVDLLDKALHPTNERSHFPPLGDRRGGEKTVLEGVRVTDRCAGRCSPVHPATAVRHRG